MKIKTDFVGDVEFEEKDVVHFERGLYGFEELQRFLLIDHPDPQMPYTWLQSIDDESLFFIVTNPFFFVDDYDFELTENVVNRLEIEGLDDLLIFAMVVIPDEVQETTINLQSPIIMNQRTRKAEQVILEERFPLKYKLYQKGVE